MSFNPMPDTKAFTEKYRRMMHSVNNLYGGTIPYEGIFFPGGEPHVKLDADLVRGQYLFISAKIVNLQAFGELLVLTDALRRAGCIKLGLFCPYFPGARQDRATDGTALTVKIYTDIINNLKFDKVLIADPHSDVTPALINNCDVIKQEEIVKEIPFTDYNYIVCPDAGAEKKSVAVAKALNINTILFARKCRDMKSGQLSGFAFNEDPNKLQGRGLLVDDICDGGGTFIGLAKHAAQLLVGRWNVDLFVTHGIFSKGFQELSQYYSRIITTDSWPNRECSVCSVVPLDQFAHTRMRTLVR